MGIDVILAEHVQSLDERWRAGVISDTYVKVMLYMISSDPDFLATAYRAMQLPEDSQGTYFSQPTNE